MTWHLGTELLDRYARGRLATEAAWSVEAHLEGCVDCRAEVAARPPLGADGPRIDDERLAAVWADVAGRIRATRRPLVERLLIRLRVPDHDARLLAATPSLTASWLLGIVVVLATALGAAWLAAPIAGSGALFPYLVLAPLVPVAGIAAAFGPRIDPTYELAVTAPMRTTRLLLLRAVAVLVSSLVLAAAGAVALPGWGWPVVAWLLPALALTVSVLALSVRHHAVAVAVIVGGGWIAVVSLVELRSAAVLAAFGPVGQLAMVVLMVASGVLFVVERARLDPVVGP